MYTPRYSVCTDTTPPELLHDTNYLEAALTWAEEHPGSVVYDWATSKQVTR